MPHDYRLTINRETDFDQLFNEGGEGYNPSRAERERREAEAEANRPVTLDDLYRELERFDCPAARESGTYDEAAIEALRARIAAMRAAEIAAFLAAWPAEVTQARRAEWNAFIRSIATSRGVLVRDVHQREESQGWSTDDLRRAIKLHNL